MAVFYKMWEKYIEIQLTNCLTMKNYRSSTENEVRRARNKGILKPKLIARSTHSRGATTRSSSSRISSVYPLSGGLLHEVIVVGLDFDRRSFGQSKDYFACRKKEDTIQ